MGEAGSWVHLAHPLSPGLSKTSEGTYQDPPKNPKSGPSLLLPGREALGYQTPTDGPVKHPLLAQ